MKVAIRSSFGFALSAFVVSRLVLGNPMSQGPHGGATICIFLMFLGTVLGYLVGVGVAFAVAFGRHDSIPRHRFWVGCMVAGAMSLALPTAWTAIDEALFWHQVDPAKGLNTTHVVDALCLAFFGGMAGGVLGAVFGGIASLFLPKAKTQNGDRT